MTEPSTQAWEGERVARWLRRAEGHERQLAPVADLLLEAADIRPGEAVLDVGCGTGPTTLEAARRAGPGGRVTGLDVAAEMLDAARAATAGIDGLAALDWVEADVSTWSSASADYDLVLSRFGVMFFDDAPAAVRHLAAATRPGGRLAVAVWGPRSASPLFAVPYEVALAVRAERGDVLDRLPEDAGPFSWHDADRVVALLSGGGWQDVVVTPHRLRLPYAGEVDAAEAAEMAVDFGPTLQAMAGADEATLAAVRAALVETFGRHLDERGHVVLDAEIRIVTARITG